MQEVLQAEKEVLADEKPDLEERFMPVMAQMPEDYVVRGCDPTQRYKPSA